MTEKPQLTDLADLEARLKRARGETSTSGGEQAERGPDAAKGRGFGLAMRLSTDLVAGVAVGSGLGWLIDKWAGSWPWGFVVCFFLGAGAGLNLAYKQALKIGRELER